MVKSFNGLSVLIVEDDPNIAAQIAYHLKSCGYKIDTASDGDIAIEKVNSGNQFDLIVLDIMMPRVTGLEVCKTLREKFNLFELPILISSALSESQDVVNGLDLGANDYITKPFQRVELLARVKNLLTLKTMSDLARANEQLAEKQSLHDNLTGLPNRKFLIKYLQEAIVQANRDKTGIALLYVNIDRFKSLNNSLGHGVGDIYLRELSKRLLDFVDEGDSVSRLYTDTFAVVKTGFKSSSNDKVLIKKYAEKLLDLVSTPLAIDQYDLVRTGSIGIALYPNENGTIDNILRYADSALYFAKAQGINSIVFHSQDLHNDETEKFALERKMQKALDEGEYVLHYQPQISASDKQIFGVEALIRWNQPGGDLTLPAQFIPVAEETGIIIPICKWVLENAIKQNHQWQDLGLPPVKMSVNIFPKFFLEPDFVEIISSLLERYQLKPEYLELEITESTLMSNVEKSLDVLRSISDMGVGLSVDDFGTGYSSLNYLKQFPVNTIKIGKAFIGRKFDKNDVDSTIVKSIIKLGHSLDMSVIAEGVETKEQFEHLRNNYCDLVQGYYFSEPVTPQSIADLLEAQK